MLVSAEDLLRNPLKFRSIAGQSSEDDDPSLKCTIFAILVVDEAIYYQKHGPRRDSYDAPFVVETLGLPIDRSNPNHHTTIDEAPIFDFPHLNLSISRREVRVHLDEEHVEPAGLGPRVGTKGPVGPRRDCRKHGSGGGVDLHTVDSFAVSVLESGEEEVEYLF